MQDAVKAWLARGLLHRVSYSGWAPSAPATGPHGSPKRSTTTCPALTALAEIHHVRAGKGNRALDAGDQWGLAKRQRDSGDDGHPGL